MSTKTRLGIDIIAANKTAAAFAGVQRSMDTIKRNVEAMKFLLAGFVGGQFLEAMMRSFVEVAKQEPRVKGALDNLTKSWNGFAKKVGEAGLNDALVNFANRMSGLIMGTDGLSRSIGAFMGGAVNMMAGLFEGIGRAIAFAYDNAAIFGRLIGGIAVVVLAQQVIRGAGAFYFFAKAVRQTGLVMSAFHAISRANLLVFLALAAGVAYATDSVDTLKSGIDMMWQKVKDVFPMIAEKTTTALEGMGFNMDALSGDIANASKWIDGMAVGGMPALAKATTSTAESTKNLASNYQGMTNALTQSTSTMSQMQNTMTQLAESMGQSFRDTFDAIIEGTMSAKEAFRSLISDMLKQVADALMSSAMQAFIAILGGGGTAGGTGNLLASLLRGFGGARAGGGPVSSTKGYLVGENGPEWFQPKAAGTIIPNDMLRNGARSSRDGGSLSLAYAPQITINGNADAQVMARALAASEARMRRELPALIREDRKRGRI